MKFSTKSILGADLRKLAVGALALVVLAIAVIPLLVREPQRRGIGPANTSGFIPPTQMGGGSGTGDIEGVTAGSGLTGGGASGSVTLDVGAGTNIVVNANDVAVASSPSFSGTVTGGALVVTGTASTQGNTTIGDSSTDDHTFNGSISTPHAHTRRLEIMEEMFDCHSSTTGGRILYSNSGTSSSFFLSAAESNHPGLCGLGTGTATNGRAAAVLAGASNLDQIKLGGGVLSYDILTRVGSAGDGLCDVTDDCVYRCGLLDQVNTAPDDGVYFEYNRASSTSWRIGTANASTRTVQTSSPAQTVTQNQWVHLQVTVNAGATSVDFSINGTAVGTITTNIPSNPSAFGCAIAKTAGTSARYAFVDYLQLTQGFTTAR